MSSHATRATALPLCLLLLAACTTSPVDWTGDKASHAPSASLLDTNGNALPDTLSAHVASVVAPIGACAGSLRATSSGNIVVAVWWSPRADSSARLLFARSADAGVSWSLPTVVDSLDRSVTGCRRAPAAIAADTASGYVHVSYGLVAPEGTGIFFAHSMDNGRTFHSPVAIVYGDRPGATSVAASGDNVAVAFEDPNSRGERVGLALSHTMGHIFEDRIVPVSDDNGAATRPLVSLRGRQLTVAWRESADGQGQPVLRIRTGILH